MFPRIHRDWNPFRARELEGGTIQRANKTSLLFSAKNGPKQMPLIQGDKTESQKEKNKHLSNKEANIQIKKPITIPLIQGDKAKPKVDKTKGNRPKEVNKRIKKPVHKTPMIHKKTTECSPSDLMTSTKSKDRPPLVKKKKRVPKMPKQATKTTAPVLGKKVKDTDKQVEGANDFSTADTAFSDEECRYKKLAQRAKALSADLVFYAEFHKGQ